MNVQTLIFPAVAMAAFSVFFGAMELPLIALGFACLTFLATLFLLAAVRREQRARKTGFSQKASDESEIQALKAKITSQEAELSTLKTQNSSYKAALDAKNKAEALEASSATGEQAVIQFVRSLQDKGRFLDFVMADIHALPDAQVGAVARVVHSGLKTLVSDYFSVAPISSSDEGARISIPEDEIGVSYRLLQTSSDQVPAQGQLVHKGWQAKAIKLPTSQRIESDRERRVLAFAEVDVKA